MQVLYLVNTYEMEAGLPRIVAVAREDNFASRMVLGGIGMAECDSFVQQGYRMVLYESLATLPPEHVVAAHRVSLRFAASDGCDSPSIGLVCVRNLTSDAAETGACSNTCSNTDEWTGCRCRRQARWWTWSMCWCRKC